MRGRSTILRDYGTEAARRDLANGVHVAVVACRMGVTEADLAVALDLDAASVTRLYARELREVGR